MKTHELLLKLKYRFRDYFFPIDSYGRTASLVGMEDIINQYTESNYIMKISTHFSKEQIILLNQLLSEYDSVNFFGLEKRVKAKFALRMEARKILIKKTLNFTSENKDHKISMPYYVAEELLNYIQEKLEIEIPFFQQNLLLLLQNQLHQKLQ